MRVLAARFPDREHASAALGRLYQRFALGPRDVSIAPLGIPGEATRDETLLAGRFPEDHTAEVDKVVRALGGEIVADIDERLTRPHAVPNRSGPERESVASH